MWIGARCPTSYAVQNTGNITVVGPVTVTHNLIAGLVCPTNDLIPGASLTCTGSYVIKIEDVQLGSVTNVATARSVTVDSAPVSETIPDNSDPSISITKTADISTIDAVGDQITYTYTVTNTSTGTPS